MSKGVVSAQSATRFKALIKLVFAAHGHSAHLRGHWAYMQTEAMAELMAPLIDATPDQISTVAA